MYIAFLRGINVGGRKVLKDDLKKCFEDAGLTNVKTILQTGNVIFDSKKTLAELKTIIEEALENRFNYNAKVIVIEDKTLKDIIQKYPFKEDPEFHPYVVFLSSDIGQELLDGIKDSKDEETKLGNNCIYWKCKKGKSLDTPLATILSKAKYKEYNTVRNLNTLEKVLKVTG